MRLTPDASGVFPIAPTPFNPDGTIDWNSADRLFDFYQGIGSDGVTVLGIMGEAPKLEPEESVGIVKRARRADAAASRSSSASRRRASRRCARWRGR